MWPSSSILVPASPRSSSTALLISTVSPRLAQAAPSSTSRLLFAMFRLRRIRVRLLLVQELRDPRSKACVHSTQPISARDRLGSVSTNTTPTYTTSLAETLLPLPPMPVRPRTRPRRPPHPSDAAPAYARNVDGVRRGTGQGTPRAARLKSMLNAPLHNENRIANTTRRKFGRYVRQQFRSDPTGTSRNR